MNPAWAPYWQTFTAIWRQRKTEKAFGFVIAIAVLMVVAWLLLLVTSQFDRLAVWRGVGVTLVFTSHVFLVLYVASAFTYNRPVCVLTVPGYLKVQRRTLVATWGVAVLVQWLGLIVGREYGLARISDNNGLLLLICAASSLFEPLAMRFTLWVIAISMSNVLWLQKFLDWWPQAMVDTWFWPVWSAYDWLLAPVFWGSMAWAVSVWVLRPGDAKHRASATVITGLQAAMRGNFWDLEARQAERPSWMHTLDTWTGNWAGANWAFNSRMAAAQSTTDSVLDRAELAFAPGTDWRARLVMAAFPVFIGVFGVWFVRLGRDSVDPDLASPVQYVFAILIGWVPFAQWHQSMQRTYREQGLLMLVPGMPSGNDLARRIGGRVLQSATVTWVVMVLMLALFVQLWPGRPMFTWLAWGLALVSLVCLPFLLRDWAHVRPRLAPSKLLLMGVPLFAGSVLLAIAMAWSGWAIAMWVVAALVATLGHLAWRWRRLATMGPPLPVGRSVA
jgi:hypothetical protein